MSTENFSDSFLSVPELSPLTVFAAAAPTTLHYMCRVCAAVVTVHALPPHILASSCAEQMGVWTSSKSCFI